MQPHTNEQMNDDGRLAGLQRRLAEAYDELWASCVDPREDFFDRDGTAWLPLDLPGLPAGSIYRPLFNEQELRIVRAQCRALAATNEFAINGHENRVSYIVGPGFNYRATVRKHVSAPPELAGRVQGVLDQFIKQNRWHRRQQELVLRCDRDGEAFLRFFPASDGLLRVRFVEPGQVSTPPAESMDPAASMGIRTEPDDVETVQAYYIDGVAVDASEIQHRKANVDGNVKRGLPLFYPVRKNLRRAEKLLGNMSVVAEIQSAIALIRRHRGTTRTATQQFVNQQADVTRANPFGGSTSFYKRYAPGTIVDANADVEYEFPAAALDAGSYVAVLQAELRAIASRLVMPEFMLSSDASNASYSSTMVAESPAVRMFERLQAQQIEDDRDVMWRVIEHACQAGRLPEAALSLIEIQVTAPSLAVRDRLEEAQKLEIEHNNGILSPQTWSQKCGLDYDQEQADIATSRTRNPDAHTS
jgi:capsid protein